MQHGYFDNLVSERLFCAIVTESIAIFEHAMSINELLDFEHYGPLSPIPLDEGPEPLAPILYDEEYKDATAYMRSLMSLNEYSLRALKITEKVIMMNPGHYTAWFVLNFH